MNDQRTILRVLLLSVLATGLSACAMVGSVQVYEVASQKAKTYLCGGKLGSYTLPKHVVSFTIVGDTNGKGPYSLVNPELKTVPDDPEKFTFCLDHLSNALYDDRVVVKRSESANGTMPSPFLETIATNGVDQSVTIIRKVIKAAFRLLSQSGGLLSPRSTDFSSGGGTVVASHWVDPLDASDMAEKNQAIWKFGFCLVLEDYTFDRSAASINQYCSSPERTLKRAQSSKARIIESSHFLVKKPVAGIFYRPKQAFTLSIYTKDDPEGPGDWLLSYADTLELANISPIVSVDINRAAFASQKTALIFDEGTLKDVCIGRNGQLAAFVDIPLDVVYGIIDLPGNRIQAAIEANTTRADLITAQDDLVSAQKAYIDYLSGGAQGAAGTKTKQMATRATTGLGSAKILEIEAENPTPNPRINTNTEGSLFDGSDFSSLCNLSDASLQTLSPTVRTATKAKT